MSDVETALTGAEVAPVANADTPQIEQAQAPESTTEQVDTQADAPPRDDKGRYVPQERVNEITRARRDAERREQAAEQRAQQAEQQLAQYTRQPSQPSADVPTLEAFGYDTDAWQRALTEHVSQRAMSQVEQRAQQYEQQRSMQQVSDRFEERSREYSLANPGFDDRLADLSRNVQFNQYVVEAIGHSDHGPAVVDYLAQHLDEADRVSRLPPHLAALQLGRIEAKVSAPKPKPVTNAPNPAPVLGGGGKTSSSVREDMSYADYKKARLGG